MSDEGRAKISAAAKKELADNTKDVELIVIHDAESRAIADGRKIIEPNDIREATKKWRRPSDTYRRIIKIGELVILALLFAQMGIYTQLVTAPTSYLLALYVLWVIELLWLAILIASDYAPNLRIR
jgi:hypothetical protein